MGESPAAEGGEAAVKQRTHLWTYGINDLIGDDVIEDGAKAFKATGTVRTDFVAFCRGCGVVPHVSLLPAKGADQDSTAENPVLVIQSRLLDRATAQVLGHVLPHAATLQTLRLSGCSLDAEQLGLLKRGLADMSAISTLHLDWNPLEVPHEDAAEVRRLAAEGKEEELDELENLRRRRQCKRLLRQVSEQLVTLFGTVEDGIAELAKVVDREHVATAMLNPLDVTDFAACCAERLFMSSEEAAALFGMLDSPEFQGCDDGLVPWARAKAVFGELADAIAEEDDGTDPLGQAFAGFLDAASPLEIVSFRYCGIARLELEAISHAIASPTPHLKALNLWGNRICDVGAGMLAAALEANFGLQYLGLGRNLVTHAGLQSLCKSLGVTVIRDKAEGEKLVKATKEQLKEKEKKMKGAPPPKKDNAGRERYTPEMYVATCEDFKHPQTGQPYWLYTRNIALKTLVLEHNPVSDADVVRKLLPYGCGDLVLRNTPCAAELFRAGDHKPPEEKAEADPPGSAGGKAADPDAPVDPDEVPPFKGAAEAVRGWRLVLQ